MGFDGAIHKKLSLIKYVKEHSLVTFFNKRIVLREDKENYRVNERSEYQI